MEILNSSKQLKDWADQTPIIPTNEATILVENAYYDGPLNGILLWKNKKYYFSDYNIEEETKTNSKRMYVVIELSKEQEGKDENWGDIFKDKSKKYTLDQDQIKARWSDI